MKRLLLRRTNGLGRFSLALSACIILLAGCGGGEEPRIAAVDPLERVVRAEDELEALKAWAASGQRADLLLRFDSFDDVEIVHPALAESMKNAADHLKRGNVDVLDNVAPLLRRSGVVALGRASGFYERVVWVLPVQSSTGDLPIDGFKNFLVVRRGYSPSDLDDLAPQGKYIMGTLGGVPLTITNLADLNLAGETAIIDIDLSYFTGIQGTESGYGAGTAAVLDFLRALREKRVETRLVTVTLSNSSRTVPVEFRYLGTILSMSLSDPTALDEPLPAMLSAAQQAEELLFESGAASADSAYRALCEAYPLEPGFRYFASLTSGLLGKASECVAHLDEAFRLDPTYAGGLFEIADELAAAGRLGAAEELVAGSAARESFTADALDYGTGVMYVKAAAPGKALPFLERAGLARQDDFRLHNLIFRASRDAGDDDGMVRSLEKLAEIDPEMVKEHMPWVYSELGRLYERKGENELAARMYRQFLEVAPSDSTIPEIKSRIRGLLRK